MQYIESVMEEVRNGWFKDHVIRMIEGEEGFQRIVWASPGTNRYLIDYVLKGNTVFVTGDLGDAVYSLSDTVDLKSMDRIDLSYFTRKLTAHSRERYYFDRQLAIEQIQDCFTDWRDVDKPSDMEQADVDLYERLIEEVGEWGSCEQFETGVYAIYRDSNHDFFDGEAASCIADCGRRLSRTMIAYWLGLVMIAEELKAADAE